jgi:16S rRNA (adenine1518-N6/adenine1519-N6)-dimethyltransferase
MRDSFFKKQFGQNFLTSREYAKKLVEAADINEEDVVVEVGAGAGMVTQYLAPKAKKIFAIEIDKRFVRMLKMRFADDENVEIVNRDILKIKNEKLRINNYKVVGSLPYNISKKVIKKFLEAETQPSSIIVIIQKEVVQDYVARPPKATFLSNYASIFGSAELVEIVPKEFFNPEPKVDGAIIKFKIKNGKLKIKEESKFIKFLKSAFLNPRKKLVNNLVGIYKIDKQKLLKIFKRLRISENARASEITMDCWKKLFEKLT